MLPHSTSIWCLAFHFLLTVPRLVCIIPFLNDRLSLAKKRVCPRAIHCASYTQLTGFVVRGPRASQPCAISKDVESS